MSLASPTTYAEWYWKLNVDASKEFDETLEKALAPTWAGVLADIPELSEFPIGTQRLLHMLDQPPTAGLGGFITGTAAEFSAEMLKMALAPAMSMLTRSINRKSLETWLTPQEAVTLNQRKKIDDTFFYLLTASAGYEKVMADFLHTSLDPYPAFPDIVRWARYVGNPDAFQADVMDRFQIDPRDWPMWDWLTAQVPHTDQIQTLYRKGTWDHATAAYELHRQGWNKDDADTVLELAYQMPNSMLLAQSGLRYR